MIHKVFKVIFTIILFISVHTGVAQDRFQVLEQKLNELAISQTPGLKEPVDFSVSGVSIQEFLRAIAETNNLNISIAADINVQIINNFNNEKVINVLLFLCKEYNLEISFVGSIMSFHNYKEPVVIKPPEPEKEVIVEYDKEKDKLTVDLEEDPLSKVVKKITQVSGKNVNIPSDIRNDKVSGYIQGLNFESALKKLAFANGLTYTPMKDGSYNLEKKEEVANDDPRNTGKGRGNRSNFTRGNGFGDGKGLGDFELKVTKDKDGVDRISFSAQEAPIVDILKTVSERIGISYLLYSEPSGNTSLTVNDLTYPEFLTFLLQGSDHTYRSDSNEVYMIGERSLEGLRANRVVQLEYRSVDEMMEMIPAELRKGVEVTEFREQNSIVLSGSDPSIQEIVNFLGEVDKVVPMVMIEVIIVDIRKTKTFEAGLSAGILSSGDSSQQAGGSILGSQGVNFNYSTGAINRFLTTLSAGTSINLGQVPPNFYFGLSALDAKGYANVRQMPKLATLNGHEANMSVGRSSYYRVQTQNLVGTQNPIVNTTEQWNEVQANLSININPVVSGDDQVTLQIDVELSDFIGAPPENAPPPSATSQFNSLVRVRNEDMIVLGGLERIEKSESGSGVPVLSRIPVIKWLFSHRTKSKSKTLTTLFIKPTIIY